MTGSVIMADIHPPDTVPHDGWELDPSTLAVRFAAWHMMIASIEGRFAGVRGAISVEDGDLTTARIALTVDVATVDTREPRRDEHLRSADFLSAADYPTMTFVSHRVDQLGDGDVRVVGDLTIRGVTRAIGLDVQPAPAADDVRASDRLKFRARGVIKRSDFGLTWNRVLETGGVLVGDDIHVTIAAELVRRAG